MKPISGSFRDPFSGWAATLVDSPDSPSTVGLREEFDKAVNVVAKLDFGQSSSAKRDALLIKAIELGDLLYASFNMPNPGVVNGGFSSTSIYRKCMHYLVGGEPKYETMSQGFLEAAKELDWVAVDGRVTLDEETEHLACYFGGIYAISGKPFRNRDYIDIGAKITLGCVYGYGPFPTGMMPERINTIACESIDNWEWDQKRFYEEKQKNPAFWQDLGWEMFTATANGTETKRGTHAAVQDVTRTAEPLPHDDYMESFWPAEALKYYYLFFCPPDIISLNDYVFNTEAHPFLGSNNQK
ncbi:hypothetical protein DL769_009325 [Monosporascus sp. CRB-8-3]|nr:hypothetical protein DL769_009325 [Monosporascus sp. CRB-8-3]